MKNLLAIVGLLGVTGVILGALGAHSLRPHLTDIQFNSYETGVRYHFYHTLAILMMTILYTITQDTRFKKIAYLFLIGIFLFSGSIYLLATRDLTGLGAAASIFGPITPVGGLVFISAWGYLIYTAFSWQSNSSKSLL